MYFSIEHMSQFRMQNTFNLFKLDNFFHLFIKNILIIIKNHIQIIIQNKNETKVESNRCGAFCMEPNTLNRSIPIYFQSYPLISRFLVHFMLEFSVFFSIFPNFFSNAISLFFAWFCYFISIFWVFFFRFFFSKW